MSQSPSQRRSLKDCYFSDISWLAFPGAILLHKEIQWIELLISLKLASRVFSSDWWFWVPLFAAGQFGMVLEGRRATEGQTFVLLQALQTVHSSLSARKGAKTNSLWEKSKTQILRCSTSRIKMVIIVATGGKTSAHTSRWTDISVLMKHMALSQTHLWHF